MERRREERLGQVVARLLNAYGLQSPLNEYRVVQAWPTVAGNAAARHTKEVYVRQQKLFVRIQSPVLRQELSLRRSELTERLNRAVNAAVITDVVLL